MLALNRTGAELSSYLVCVLVVAGDGQDVGLLAGVALGEEVAVVDERWRGTAPTRLHPATRINI